MVKIDYKIDLKIYNILSYIMPKVPIDYSKTIIYKIVCNDLNITDCYVGHTTDLTRRISQHKHYCNNTNNKNYDCKKYKTIRDNGGWENWQVVMIEVFNCKNKLEATKRERECFEELQANLNTYRPHTTQQEYRELSKQRMKRYGKLYREINTEKLKEKSNEYYENNKEKISKRHKDYHERNKEMLNEHKKEYYLRNKEKISEKNKEKVCCSHCNKEISRSYLNKHIIRKHNSDE